MSVISDRFDAAEEARKRIRRAATDLALTEQVQDRLPEGVTVTDRISWHVDDALKKADKGAHAGLVWSYSASLVAQSMEAFTSQLRKGDAA